MKTATFMPKSAPAVVLCAVAGLALSLFLARPATAWYDDSGWGDDAYDSGWSEERMQDAAIASAEEQAREAGRAKRRDELAEEKKQKSAEHEEYYAAIIDASKASLNAPRGVFYRKPGYITADPPSPTAQTVAAGPVSLVYDQGIYWLPRGGDYIAVIPPFGVVVDTLPPGVRAIPTKGGMVYYFFGTFYRAKDGKFEVVKPPSGMYVGYLPDGYVQETGKDATVFKFGEVSFKQVFLQGALAYQVI